MSVVLILAALALALWFGWHARGINDEMNHRAANWPRDSDR